MSRLLLITMGAAAGFSLHMTWASMTEEPTIPAPPPSPTPAPPSPGTPPPPFSTQSIDAEPATLLDLPSLRPPQPLQFVSPEEATEEWRQHDHRVVGNKDTGNMNRMQIEQSIYYPGSDKLGAANQGYIMVAVMTCCDKKELSRLLLDSLTAMSDPMHVVVIDDGSTDGLQEMASDMGYPVLSVAKNKGATHSMNRAWQYFTAHPELQSMWILNNDIIVSEGTFTKLHRCAMEAPAPGVVGPMSNLAGLGKGLEHQNAEHRATRHHYGGEKPPEELRDNLPDSLPEYNAWLEAHTADTKVKAHPVGEVFGFFMGFRKDHPMADMTDNILLRGGRSLHQEYFLFYTWRLPAYVCLDVFAFHEKAGTLKAVDGRRVVVNKG